MFPRAVWHKKVLIGSNDDDSHAYDAWYKKLLSSVDLTKGFVLAAHTQLCKAYKGNMLIDEVEKMPYENMFVWNCFGCCS